MMENESILPAKFMIYAADQFYNCAFIDNHYHIWADGQDYEAAAHRGEVGIWKFDEILHLIHEDIWRIVSIQDDYADEEDISVDSLEGIL